jgi:acylglycerol lipase
VHGFSDHISRYYELFPTLAKRGILCTGIDQRGWGESAKTVSDRGNTGPTSTILSDLASLIKSHLSSPTPVFVMGHSMGGAEVLTMASTPEYKGLISQLSGILLESPYIALPPDKATSYLTLLLAKFASFFFPKSQITNRLSIEDVVHDSNVQQDILDDPLCNATGTLEMFSNMLDRAANLHSGKLVLNDGVKALWLSHGTDDRVTSYAASQEWYEREGKKVGDKEFKTYKGWSHELHCDTLEHRPIFAKDVGDWILKRVTI